MECYLSFLIQVLVSYLFYPVLQQIRAFITPEFLLIQPRLSFVVILKSRSIDISDFFSLKIDWHIVHPEDWSEREWSMNPLQSVCLSRHSSWYIPPVPLACSVGRLLPFQVGFDTKQGRLLRMLVFSKDSYLENDLELRWQVRLRVFYFNFCDARDAHNPSPQWTPTQRAQTRTKRKPGHWIEM